MSEPTHVATLFAQSLNEKFEMPDPDDPHGEHFVAVGGRTWDKIVPMRNGRQSGIHAFVHRANETIHKAETLSRMVHEPRYADVASAVEAADRHGGYLYKR